MSVFTVTDYYCYQLSLIHDAEKRWSLALSSLIAFAPTLLLQLMLRNQAQTALYHVRRLQALFSEMDLEPVQAECKSMRGQIEDALDVAATTSTNELRAAAIAAVAQRVEHLEISLYDEVIQLAAVLGFVEHMYLLDDSLNDHHDAAFRFGALTQPHPAGHTADAMQIGGTMTIRDLGKRDANAMREHGRDNKTVDIYDEVFLGSVVRPQANADGNKVNKTRKPARKEQDSPKDKDQKGEPLVSNINDDDGVDPNKDEQGVDNIDDAKQDMKEDMKGDALGGTTQVPDSAAEDDKELPQRSG